MITSTLFRHGVADAFDQLMDLIRYKGLGQAGL